MTIHLSACPLSMESVKSVIKEAMESLLGEQSDSGAWTHGFDMGVMPDAQTAIFLHALAHRDPQWTCGLIDRIQSAQNPDGSWSAYTGAPGDLSTTIECYYALTLYGAWHNQEAQYQTAVAYILRNGGLYACRNLTKVLLAVTGEIPWVQLPPPALYAWLFSETSLVNLWDLVTFTRLHVASMVILSAHRYVAPTVSPPVLRHLIVPADKRRGGHLLHKLPVPHRLLRRCIQYLYSQAEPDGSLAGYHSSTFLFLCAKVALGMPFTHPEIHSGIEAVRASWGCPFGDATTHQQTCDAHIWNTALTLRALRAAGLSQDHTAFQSGAHYLAHHQHVMQWDAYRQSYTPGGGWGFSHNNTRHPDADDTVACLDALSESADFADVQWQSGAHWLLTRQNRDGGWSAFDQNCGKRWLEKIPANDMRHAISDPSTPDITARVIELLVTHGVTELDDPRIGRAVRWLLRAQEKDGSWYGRWGTTYLYGTWCVVRALCAIGMSGDDEALVRARTWLLYVAHYDGSFGESCESDEKGRFAPLDEGLPSQTAWALDTLLSLYHVQKKEVEKKRLAHASDRSANWLVAHYKQTRWREVLPTGSAFPGSLHIRYHLYPKVWPLLALTHYQKMRNQ